MPSIIAAGTPLHGTISEAISGKRCIVFVGLPGMGKSLMLQQAAILLREAGKSVHTLQWDVASQPFKTSAALRQFPENNGITHSGIRAAAGLWVRGAIAAWDAAHPGDVDVLLAEAPIIGGRFVELVQPHDDRAESLLASPRNIFLVTVPSAEVRDAARRRRGEEMAAPRHEREAANATVHVADALMEQLRAAAPVLGVDTASSSGYDARLYEGVYRRVLHRRHAATLPVNQQLAVTASVYDAAAGQSELVPSPAEVETANARAFAMADAEIAAVESSWLRL